MKYEIAAREHQHLVYWKVDYLQDLDARWAPGDFFNGQLGVGVGMTSTVSKPRLWPAVVIVAFQAALVVYSVTAQFDNFSRFIAMVAGPLVCALPFLVYWLFFSRIPWRERLIVLLLAAIIAGVTFATVDSSVQVAVWNYGIPLTMLLLVLGLFFGRHAASPARMAWVALLLVMGWLPWQLLRLDGFDGSYYPELAWRWSPTTEEQVLASRSTAEVSETAITFPDEPPAWPAFRGPNGDSRVRGARIRTDWAKTPPTLLWKTPIGPGWGSFAVAGSVLFTQEQLGNQESIVCYDAATGKERWRHSDDTRFNEVVSGPGPRATPTFAGGRLYTLGANANLNCLDAGTGKVHWCHDLMKEMGAKELHWGHSSSPLVTDRVAIVYVNGTEGNGLVAFNIDDGAPAWKYECSGENYSSAQLVRLGDGLMVLFNTSEGLVALDPTTGKELWQAKPEGFVSAAMVQPQHIGANAIMLTLGDGVGSARLEVSGDGDTWNATTAWSANTLKPSFNDFVFINGTLFGFDQNIFAAVDAASGKRLWKKGRYGFGQVMLFEEQGLLLVLTERGEIVLLRADKKQSEELGRFEALRGKTWNHPAFANGVLYLRNGQEAVALDVSETSASEPTPELKPQL